MQKNKGVDMIRQSSRSSYDNLYTGDENMRTFYIFNINKSFYNLMKNNPYHLFRAMEDIHSFDCNDADMAYDLFNQIASPFDKSKINNKIFGESKDNDFYSKFHNVHRIQNKYVPEDSMLVVNKAFLLLESNITKPTFLNELKEYNNLFVCDFKNKDYFWVNELLSL